MTKKFDAHAVPFEGVSALVFTPDPALSSDYLDPPFVGHVFWNANRIVGCALADFILAQVNPQVSAMVGGGTLIGDLDAGSLLGPLVSDTYNLSPAAQIIQHVTLKPFTQTLLNFMANGARGLPELFRAGDDRAQVDRRGGA